MENVKRVKPVLVWLFGAAALAAGVYVGRAKWSEPSEAARAQAPERHDAAAAPERYKIPVSPSQPVQGPSDALVTIVTWSDFLCAECAQAERTVESVLGAHASEARWVWRNLPAQDPLALKVAELALVAQDDAGKFWQARDLVRASAATYTEAQLESDIVTLGLDVKATHAALDAHTDGAFVTSDQIFAQAFGVKGPFAVFVNGVPFEYERDDKSFRANLDALVLRELAHAKQVRERGVAAADVYDAVTEGGSWGVRDLQEVAANQ